MNIVGVSAKYKVFPLFISTNKTKASDEGQLTCVLDNFRRENMLFKDTTEKNSRYLKPIFSDFEKEYLLSELDMIIENGGDIFEFDSLETNRFSVYFFGGRRYFIGFCSGTLSNVLWTLLTTKLMDEEIYYGSYLGFAIESGIGELQSGHMTHMTLSLDSNKIKQFFLTEDLFRLITENRSDSSKCFIEVIENVNRATLR